MKQRRTTIRRLSAMSLGLLLVLSFAVGASAHETREVGEFEFVVGFTGEPAYVNEMNGLALDISRPGESGESDDAEEDGHGSSGEPVENAQTSLNVAIVYGEDRQDLELRQVFGEPGSYTADVIPTETGAYSFEITGEIDGQEIDETFTAGPDTFSEIEPRDGLEFPGGGSSESGGVGDQATAFGMAGIAAGLLGLIAGGAAFYKVNNNEPRQPGPAERRRQQKRQETE